MLMLTLGTHHNECTGPETQLSYLLRAMYASLVNWPRSARTGDVSTHLDGSSDIMDLSLCGTSCATDAAMTTLGLYPTLAEDPHWPSPLLSQPPCWCHCTPHANPTAWLVVGGASSGASQGQVCLILNNDATDSFPWKEGTSLVCGTIAHGRVSDKRTTKAIFWQAANSKLHAPFSQYSHISDLQQLGNCQRAFVVLKNYRSLLAAPVRRKWTHLSYSLGASASF